MRNNPQAIVYDWDDVIVRTAHEYFQLLQETAKKLGSRPTEKDKFINCGVSHSMLIPSIAELPKILQGDLNG